jgi:hypothetical protein
MTEDHSPVNTREHHSGESAQSDFARTIHRVCVTCNNMFETDLEHFDAKQCPVCRRA